MSDTPIELRLQVVFDGGASDDHVERAARNLRSELLESGFDNVEFAEDARPLPAGAKGGTGHVVGDIVLAMAPVVLPKLFELLKEWRRRTSGRSFKLTAALNNHVVDVTFDGLHPESATEVATQLMDHLRQAQTARGPG